MKITLYRVRRPDGTVIECSFGRFEEEGFDNAAWVDQPLNKTVGGLLATGRNWAAAESAGYSIEPVKFVERSLADKLLAALRESNSPHCGSCGRCESHEDGCIVAAALDAAREGGIE